MLLLKTRLDSREAFKGKSRHIGRKRRPGRKSRFIIRHILRCLKHPKKALSLDNVAYHGPQIRMRMY